MHSAVLTLLGFCSFASVTVVKMIIATVRRIAERGLWLLLAFATCLQCATVCSAQITLDGSNHCSSGGLSVSTVSCTLPGVSAGDLITVEFSDRNGYMSTVSDGVNGHIARSTMFPTPAIQLLRHGLLRELGCRQPDRRLSLSASDPWAKISVQAWKGAAASSVLDTGLITQNLTSTSGTVAMPLAARRKHPMRRAN